MFAVSIPTNVVIGTRLRRETGRRPWGSPSACSWAARRSARRWAASSPARSDRRARDRGRPRPCRRLRGLGDGHDPGRGEGTSRGRRRGTARGPPDASWSRGPCDDVAQVVDLVSLEAEPTLHARAAIVASQLTPIRREPRRIGRRIPGMAPTSHRSVPVPPRSGLRRLVVVLLLLWVSPPAGRRQRRDAGSGEPPPPRPPRGGSATTATAGPGAAGHRPRAPTSWPRTSRSRRSRWRPGRRSRWTTRGPPPHRDGRRRRLRLGPSRAGHLGIVHGPDRTGRVRVPLRDPPGDDRHAHGRGMSGSGGAEGAGRPAPWLRSRTPPSVRPTTRTVPELYRVRPSRTRRRGPGRGRRAGGLRARLARRPTDTTRPARRSGRGCSRSCATS